MNYKNLLKGMAVRANKRSLKKIVGPVHKALGLQLNGKVLPGQCTPPPLPPSSSAPHPLAIFELTLLFLQPVSDRVAWIDEPAGSMDNMFEEPSMT